jgi:hypothetical protein
VLRYRLRAKFGDRPSSLAHTGEPLSEPGPHCAAGRPGPPDGVQSAFAPACAGGEGAAGGRLSWVEQFPSDFVYRQNLVRGVEAAVAARTGAQSAAAGRSSVTTEGPSRGAEPGASTLRATPPAAPLDRSSSAAAGTRAPPPASRSMPTAPQQSAASLAAALAAEAGQRSHSSPPDAPFRLGRALLLPPTASWDDNGAAGVAGSGADGGSSGSQRWLLPGGSLADLAPLAVPGPA